MKRSVSKKLNQETLLESALKNGPQRELKTAWDSLGQAKSILRQVDSKMTDMSMPSSADVLWNLPDFLYCLVDQENLNKTAKPDTENESERNESVSDVETKVSRRKVSCWDNTKADSNIEDRSISSSPRNAGVNGKFSSSKRASLDKRVANSATDSTLFSVGDSSLHPQSSLWNGSSRNDESNVNSTSCSAVRDTEIRFLNDDVVAERKPLSQEAPQPPRLHRVDVIVRDDCNETGSFGHSQNLKKAPPQEPASSDGLDNLKSILKHREMEFASSHIPFDKVSDETLNVPRKVAYAPSATVYRGFNRPLVRVKSLPLKAEWMRDNLSANNNSVDDQPQEPVADVVPDLFVAADVPSKKFGRVVAVGNNELAKKDVIRTDSWRAGAKLQRELGLTYSARPKSRSTIDQNSSARSKQTGGKEATAIPEEGEIPDDVLKDRLKDILTAKEEEKKESVKAKARKKKKSRSPTPENRKEKVTKVILYDASAARKYIRKQKEQRRREKMEKKEAETRMKAEKQQRLEDLSKRQHEAAMKSRRREPVEINNEDQWMNMKNMLVIN